MAADKFRQAEDEYFKLRGQFDTGRLTQEQFDEKLRELMQQDAQGRYWMLGADSAKWYYYDGTKWVQSDPYPGSTPPPVVIAAAAPPVSAPVSPLPPAAPVAAPAKERGFPIIPVLVIILLLILGAVAYLLYQNRDRIFVAQAPNQITPILPPTITRAPSPTALGALPTVPQPTLIQPTLAPLATAVPTATSATANPTQVPTNPPDAPTPVPATSVPAITVIVVTAEPTVTVVLPTLLPSATVPPTTVPTSAPTKIPPTATSAPPTNTALPNFPPNVYVTKLDYSTPAKRNQNVTFTATFLNSTGGTSYYNWLILLYDPEKPGNNKGFGESPATGISVPPGQSKFSVTYMPVNGPGGCKSLYMRAGYKLSAFDKPIFANTGGDPTTVSFDVCP